MITPKSFSDVEIQTRLDLAADNEVKLERAREALANITLLTENYLIMPKMHASALQSIDKMAKEALKRTI